MGQKVSSRSFGHGSRHRKSSDQEGTSSTVTKASAKHFCGIICIQLDQAEMHLKDRWFACVSLGQQTFRTSTSTHTDKPVWKSAIKIALEENGPRIARISIFETNRLSKNNLVGYCEINLLDAGNFVSDECHDLLELYDPSTKTKVVGKISLGYTTEDRLETERSFARRLLSIMDEDENGELSLQEFRVLIKAFGTKVSSREIEDLFIKADCNGDGKVSADELAQLLAEYHEKSGLMNRCPVCGQKLDGASPVGDIIHISLCFNEGTGYQSMTGGFLTDKQASYGWMFKLSEWTHFSSYDVGLKEGSNASHILVFDRRTQRLEEELIDNKILLAMRAIYQARVGRTLIDKGTKELLVNISKQHGVRMNSPESVKEIPKFIEFFQDRINVDEFKYPVDHYKTFNEFFIRELKPGVRPIAYDEKDNVAVCGADSRLMVYKSCDDAKRFWIKGRNFSLNGLLGGGDLANNFDGGSLAIFRLAPQDYHRFHIPVSCVVGEFVEIPGHLYTVNPVAVNSKKCNVFTENKRVVNVVTSKEFGKVAFVAIGATMVGTITFTKKVGDFLKKGDEFGYFSFGGSTVICVFQKGAIDFDEDLVANSERSLETLVFMGMSLGISTDMSEEDIATTPRPTIRNSVMGLDNDIARKGIKASQSFNARGTGLGDAEENEEEDDGDQTM